MQLKFLLLLPSVDNSLGRPLLPGQHSSSGDGVCSVPVSLSTAPVPGVGRQPGLLLALCSHCLCFSEVSGRMFALLNKQERKDVLIIALRAGKESDPPAA